MSYGGGAFSSSSSSTAAAVVLLVSAGVRPPACGGGSETPAPPIIASERRFQRSESISRLASRLETITGVPPSAQRLHFYEGGAKRQDQNELAPPLVIEDPVHDERLLGDLPVGNYMMLHVTDTRPVSAAASMCGQSLETADVPKMVMSDVEYDKRSDSVRAFKRALALGRFSENAELARAEKSAARAAHIATLHIGARCAVNGVPGTIRYLGPNVSDADDDDQKESSNSKNSSTGSIWAGVEFDEPRGRHDGSVNGTRLFNAKPGHAVLVRPWRVEVGEFPVCDARKELLELCADDLEINEI